MTLVPSTVWFLLGSCGFRRGTMAKEQRLSIPVCAELGDCLLGLGGQEKRSKSAGGVDVHVGVLLWGDHDDAVAVDQQGIAFRENGQLEPLAQGKERTSVRQGV